MVIGKPPDKLKGQFIKGKPKGLPRSTNPQIQRISIFSGKILNKQGAI